MKRTAFFLASALLLAAGDSLAQEAGLSAAEEATAAESQTSGFTLDAPIDALAADPGARAVLERELPGLTDHDSYEQFKSMSLRALQPFSGGLITDERLAAVETGLAEIADPEGSVEQREAE